MSIVKENGEYLVTGIPADMTTEEVCHFIEAWEQASNK